MTLAYLWTQGVLYAVFAAWCTLRPESTSAFLGLSPVGAKGLSEFVAVYGGLEAGLAVFYFLSVARPELRTAALLVSACLYGGLVVFRALILVRSGFAIGTAAYAMGFEVLMGAAAVALLVARR